MEYGLSLAQDGSQSLMISPVVTEENSLVAGTATAVAMPQAFERFGGNQYLQGMRSWLLFNELYSCPAERAKIR